MTYSPTFLRRMLLAIALLVPGCASFSWPGAHADKKVAAAKADSDKNLSPFQRLIRSRLPQKPPIDEVFLLESNPLDGAGEGTYVAVLRTGKTAELRYFEQINGLPRADRFFHRLLSPEETAGIFSIVREYPLPPARAGAQARVITQTPAPDGNDEAPPADEENDPLFAYRLFHVDKKGTSALDLAAGADTNAPVQKLIDLVTRLAGAQPLACTYFQPIPPTATLLFADPHRHIERVWAQGDTLKAVIAPTAPPATSAAEPPPEEWYEYSNRTWIKSTPPPEEAAVDASPVQASSPADASVTADKPVSGTSARPPVNAARPTAALVPENLNATDSAGAAVIPLTPRTIAPEPAPAATAPSVEAAPAKTHLLDASEQPNVFPEAESWSTEPGATYTVVWHFIPLGPTSAIQRGFVVPAFVFDDDHMAIDGQRHLLYLIHEGQLFKLPMPGIAFSGQ